MREILFRGKTKDGKWVEGFLFNSQLCRIFWATAFKKEEDNMFYCEGEDVNPETIGQYTGLTDKNGKKIFEGDIVVVKYPKGDICCVGDVQFQSGVFGAEWASVKINKSMLGSWGQNHNLRRFDNDIIERIEVIGDIYDNPELLEVEE